MKKLMIALATAGLVLSPVAGALAQQQNPAPGAVPPAGAVDSANMKRVFEDFDANKDGMLSWDELSGIANLAVTEETFGTFDADDDDALSYDEAVASGIFDNYEEENLPAAAR